MRPIITLAATVFVFAVIVLIHEFGHFIMAKLMGMKVLEFSLGFGPKICSVRKGDTMYSVRSVPLGGFNRIQGMSGETDSDPKNFNNHPAWQRLLVVFAGPLFNFILAFILFWGVLLYTGVETFPNRPVVGTVMEGSAAQKAGLQPGDLLISINGNPVEKWTDISPLVGHKKSVVEVTFSRDGKTQSQSLIPQESGNGQMILGITPYAEHHAVTAGEALRLSLQRIIWIIKAIFMSIGSMIQGENLNEVAGPIGVARMAGDIAELGFVSLLLFTAFLSLNLGLLNLLPIPLLDGGLIFVTLLEEITRHKFSDKAVSFINMVGISVLAGLFMLSMTNDITALFK